MTRADYGQKAHGERGIMLTVREREPESPLRIALLSPCFWPEVRRGGERFTRELANGLLSRGDKPTLITSHPGWPSRRVEDGLPVLRVPRPPQNRLLRRHYEPYLTHVPLIYLALRLGAYDLAHAVYPADALAGARWKRITGRPLVLSYLGIPDHAGLREYRRRLENLQRALESCDALVALSRYAADAFSYWLGYEARVISPGVDLAAFRPAERRTPHPTILCSAAVEVPRKHVPLLVDAFSRVRGERPDARLLLSRPRHEAGARQLGVDHSAPGVEWLDLDDRDRLAAWNASAWVAVLPGQDEAFGLVLVEALACGTPVVGFAHAAIPELIDRPEIGRLFDRLDPDSLAIALIQALELAEDPATGARCRARAEDYSTDRFVESYVSLYSELL